MQIRSLIMRVCQSAFGLCLLLQPGTAAFSQTDIEEVSWRQVEPGYFISQYNIPGIAGVLKSQILLLKFSRKHFSFDVVSANELGSRRTNIQRMTENVKGIAGINANFFDKQGMALGLMIKKGSTHNKMHRGGALLNGVFHLSGKDAEITLRENFDSHGVELGLQSGPVLILNGKPLNLKRAHIARRRSGVAITKTGDIILFATLLPFPGATFHQVQNMLLKPRLNIKAALNFDGGSSSQLFIRKNEVLPDDTFITGGENVPVGLIVLRKGQHSLPGKDIGR